MVLLAVAAIPAAAQTEDTSRPDSVREVYRDWVFACGPAAAAAADTDGAAPDLVCRMSQRVNQPDTNLRVLELVLAPAANGRVTGEFIAPFGLDLATGLKLRIDEGVAWTVPFRTCVPEGCLAPLPLTDDRIAALRAGGTLAVEMQPAADGAEPIVIALSLLGFSAAYQRLLMET